MKLTIKKEYLDTIMSDPFNGKVKSLRFLPEDMYIHYYNVGYSYYFDIETPVTDKIVAKNEIKIEKSVKKNDKSE